MFLQKAVIVLQICQPTDRNTVLKPVSLLEHSTSVFLDRFWWNSV